MDDIYHNVFARTLTGAIAGVLIATLFAGYVLILWLIDPSDIQSLNLTPTKAVVFYGTWGVLTGAVVGFAFPITRHKAGAGLLGAFVITAGLAGANYIHNPTVAGYVFSVVAGSVTGAVAGVKVVDQYWASRDGP